MPVDNIDEDLVSSFDAERSTEAEAAQRFESSKERGVAMEHARSYLRTIGDLLLAKLVGAPKEAARRVLTHMKPCDEWLFNSIFEFIIDGVSSAELAKYVTQARRVRGGTEFHIISVSRTQELFSHAAQLSTRSGHVVLRAAHPRTAVGMMTPITFRHTGEGHMSRVSVTAGFGALAENNNGAPDWRFEKARDSDMEAAKLFISEALLEMEARNAGMVPQSMLDEVQAVVDAADGE